MNHSTSINHETNRYGMYHPILFCLPLVHKGASIVCIVKVECSYIYIYMYVIERKKRNVDDPSFIVSSSPFYFLYVYMLSPLMRATEKGGAMAKSLHEYVRVS